MREDKSSTHSSSNGSTLIKINPKSEMPDDEVAAQPVAVKQPVAPPRRKRGSSTYDSASEYGDYSYKPTVRRSASEEILALGQSAKDRIDVDYSEKSGWQHAKVKRSASDRHSMQAALNDLAEEEGDDIYTRVALPRSKSFLSMNNQERNELFSVMKANKLNSVDDLLEEIVSPQGMSFTEMKPAQREMLMKLAMNLSKDEIYHRSKQIMRKHNKKKNNMGGLMSVPNKDLDTDTDASAISNVLKATKRSLFKFTSMRQSKKDIISPIRKSQISSPIQIQHKPAPSVISGGSVVRRKKNQAPPPPENPIRHRKLPPIPTETATTGCNDHECSDPNCCDAETKCYCSLRNKMKNHGNKHNLTASCNDVCSDTDKCYCSLKMKTKSGAKFYEVNLDSGKANKKNPEKNQKLQEINIVIVI
jgi:hypothetical protein